MKTVISKEYIIIDSDQEDTHSPIESTTEEESQSMESESDEETSCATNEGKIRLFQKYISFKILIQSSKYQLLLNFKVLSRFTSLLFFNVNLPKEIITYINNIFIELRRKFIAVDFDLKKFGNICPCDENLHCHERWYDKTNYLVCNWIDKNENSRITLWDSYLNPLEFCWDVHHCHVEKKGGECHNIFIYCDGEEEYNDGFIEDGFFCLCCNRYCCLECQSVSDYCIECSDAFSW